VQAIERQVSDGQELARQQAELLKIQSGQLELQREQLEDQRKASMKQADVLDLQAAELRESLEERKREAERRRRAQAGLVFLDQKVFQGRTAHEAFGAKPPDAEVAVVNGSDQPIYEVELRWHRGSASWGEPNPMLLGVILPGEHDPRTDHHGLPAGRAAAG
jgi:hypothetical protein